MRHFIVDLYFYLIRKIGDLAIYVGQGPLGSRPHLSVSVSVVAFHTCGRRGVERANKRQSESEVWSVLPSEEEHSRSGGERERET